jgi:hypothetical protein
LAQDPRLQLGTAKMMFDLGRYDDALWHIDNILLRLGAMAMAMPMPMPMPIVGGGGDDDDDDAPIAGCSSHWVYRGRSGVPFIYSSMHGKTIHLCTAKAQEYDHVYGKSPGI